MEGIEMGLQRVDKVTVNAMELWAPGRSTSDAKELESKVLDGKIFSGFRRDERTIIWGNICKFKGIIPSLSNFFKDIHLLRLCVDGMKWLVTVSREEGTILTALKNRYKSKRRSQRVQVTESTFRWQTGSPEHCFRLGYLGLFALVLQNYKDLAKTGKKNSKEMPRAKADLEVLQRIASWAAELGFESPEIEMLKGNSKPLLITNTSGAVPPLITTGPGVKRNQRRGLPLPDTFKRDKKYLFLDNLCEDNDETGEGITSFFVLKSWFSAFFGPLQKIQNPTPAAHDQQDDVDMVDAGLGAQILDNNMPLTGHGHHVENVNIANGQPGTLHQQTTRPAQQNNAIEAGQIFEEDTLFGTSPPVILS